MVKTLPGISAGSAGRTQLVSGAVCRASAFPKKTIIKFGRDLRSVLAVRAAEAGAAFAR